MDLANVSNRRQRKSLLGTRRRGRESILPQLSDTLFSIYEEKRETYDSVLSVEETVAFRREEKQKSPELSDVHEQDDTIRNSPVTHFESAQHTDSDDLSFRNERTLPIRRLDSLFISPLNDDSFVNHEAMLANDSSVLATTLVHESPEETSALVDEFPKAEQNQSVTDTATATENVPKHDQLDSKAVENWKKTVVDSNCDINRQMIQFLEKKIGERTEFYSSCSQQIEELQKKADESSKEIEEMKTIKQYLLTKLRVPARENKENVVPDASVSMLPPNAVSDESKSQTQFTRPSRQTRAPRASVLLTAHSLSHNVQNQFEELLK